MKTTRFQIKSLCSAIAVSACIGFTSMANAKPPLWDDRIDGTNRFKVLGKFDNEAVLDKETGLVWERSPAQEGFTWSSAHYHCNTILVGNRQGWRLPTLQELKSLYDPTYPYLPANHPFEFVGPGAHFWSATTDAEDYNRGWIAFFTSAASALTGPKSGGHYVWCVRGGSGPDAQ